jgi:integrase/recombinase XerD
MRNVKPIRYEKKQRRSLTREELEKMRRACRTNQERAVLDVLYSTGCRASELIGIRIEDIDFSEREVLVLGKGKKYRKVQLNAAAILSIRAYLADRDDGDPHLIVSTHAPHDAISRESLGKIVKRVAERAGIRGVSPHILRHTFATLAMQSGMAVQNVQRSLGHEQIGTTMIYAEINDAEVKAQHERCVV